MKEHSQEVNYIVSEILMRNNTAKGKFLIVEGEDDMKLYSNFINTSKCNIRFARGKPNVLDVMTTLLTKGINKAIAIIDADFDHIYKNKYMRTIFTTDVHDLELMIIKSEAFNKLLCEFCDLEKVEKIQRKFHEELKETFIKCSSIIGCLRFYANKNKLGLDFKDLEFDFFIDSHTFNVDLKKMIVHVVGNSQIKNNISDELMEGLRYHMEDDIDAWNISCGHDYIQIFKLGVENNLGFKKSMKLNCKDIERNLRLSYEYSHFKETGLYKKIRQWEKDTNDEILKH